MYFEREICFDLEFVFVLLYFVFYVLLYLSFLIAHTNHYPGTVAVCAKATYFMCIISHPFS